MANFIENSNRAPELLETSLKSLITPVANFVGTLTALPAATVEIVGDDDVVYGTFNLTALNTEVSSGLLTALPARMKFRVASAVAGLFNIKIVITP
jgi:hypothetical protein